ncbi:MAG: indole-3-glycerol phosphate synthase TrpC [Ignavibacteriales bacterium]|nr:indole-3-glycerol phosphate synthase TrpC [Ignavibacteriales bacterium]
MSFLNKILEVKKEEIKKLKAERTLNSFGDEKFFSAPTKSLRNSLNRKDRLGLIAEIKKASPSKGVIKPDFDHMKIAEVYLKCGTDAISILTDKNFFQGDIRYISDIAEIKNVPLLRKDFIIDEYQIFEAKAFGSDAVLLIAEALSAMQIKELSYAAAECNLEVLLEFHSASQLSKIDFKTNNLIGINNRDLETFEVNLNATLELSKKIPHEVIVTSESGLSSESEIKKILEANVKAVLVGEHFMLSKNIEESVNEFLRWS